MAHKHKILQRYNNEEYENTFDSFHQRASQGMQSKFSKMEDHIQRLKRELNLKDSMTKRATILEDMFIAVRNGVYGLMEDLLLLVKLRRIATSEVNALKECIDLHEKIIQKKKELIGLYENHPSTKSQAKNDGIEEKKAISGLNGNYWRPPKSAQRKIKRPGPNN